MKISNRDWAQLSAYVDGELSQRELIQLQNRIEDNPDFQAALEGLQNVKAVLAHTPKLSVPRNFKVTRVMVEIPQKQPQVMGYRLAAAALSFLFIAVVVLDIGSVALKGGMLAAQAPRAEEVMLEAAVDEMEEPAMQMAKEAVEEEAAPTAAAEDAAEAPQELEAAQEGESLGVEGDAAMATEAEADRAAVGAEDYGEDSQETQNLLSEDQEIEAEEAWVPPDQEIDRTLETPAIPWMRILEITFGLGAVGFGVAAWINRRKNRKS